MTMWPLKLNVKDVWLCNERNGMTQYSIPLIITHRYDNNSLHCYISLRYSFCYTYEVYIVVTLVGVLFSAEGDVLCSQAEDVQAGCRAEMQVFSVFTDPALWPPHIL